MALHRTPEEHASDPPATWLVRKAGRQWSLHSSLAPDDGALDTFCTRHEAEGNKVSGWLVDLYEQEGRWFRGEPVANWRPYQSPTVKDAAASPGGPS